MQLGTRWAFGGEPPARLSAELVERIRGVEAAHADGASAGWRWTLTWLEGRAVVELDAPDSEDDGLTLRG